MVAKRVPAGELSGGAGGNIYRLDRVSLQYRARNDGRGAITNALKDITLNINAGEMVAIVGQSGSGKSSLLHVMAALTRVDDGHVYFTPQDELESIPMHELSEDQCARLRRKHIGFVYQAFNLVDTMTAAENVALPLLFSGVAPREREQRANHLLEQFGLGEQQQRFPYELSGGQQQRVAIARALAMDASVILADEPTGSLDSKSAASVLDALQEQHASHGKTIVLVTHDLAVADRLKARRVELHDGRIGRENAK